MPCSYGKMPRHARKTPTAPVPAEIEIKLTERHTLEQLSLELQRAVAILQDYGVGGVDSFRMQFLPLDDAGAPMIVFDDEQQQVATIDIPEQKAKKPYRDNEPGLGAPHAGPGSTSSAPRTSSRPSGDDPSRIPGGAPPPRVKG